MTKFIAIDGEADNKGNYIIMCDSEGRVLYNPGGITSTEALEFLLSLPRKCEIVCYGLNYDANQWLKDLDRSCLELLAGTHKTIWRNLFQLEWIPSKMFTVRVPHKSITVSEVFGFFQTSFVKALQQWGFDPPSEIETMKQKRGTFTHKELQRVVAYCQAECKLLVQLMERLEDACRQADCVPRRRWIGAGSIASSLLMSHGTSKHHSHDLDLFGPEYTEDFVLRSYFGGRVELYQQGWHNVATSFDVRSAYPYAAMYLPSLADAQVRYGNKFEPGNPFAMYRVQWDMRGYTGQIAPFPVRLPNGEICYPLQGEGVYHSHEVDIALKHGYPVEVLESVCVSPADGNNPLAWINDVYTHRARFKREGNYAEKALKLGMNSIYGKFAQGYGFGRKPPFQSYYWAGFITSFTRARILDMLCTVQQPVMTATDGIVCAKGPHEDYGDAMGTWEKDGYDRVATIQPGVYVAERDGERIVKSRGFFARDVDYDEMIERFEADSLSAYHFTSRRFIGLKVALHRKDFGVWRQWIDERRSIGFEIKNKRRQTVNNSGTVYLYPIQGPFSSIAYEPKQSLYDDPTDSTLENMVRDDQPHREVD